MRPTIARLAAILASALLGASAQAGPPAYPVRVSDDGRYFVDAEGKPVFWLGTTQWELFRGYKLEDALTILEKTRSHGFAFVQVKLLGQGDGTRPNAYGEEPLVGDDASKPNEAYFRHVDAVVRAARERGLAISMTVYHQSYRKTIPLEKARAWAKWLAERYRDDPNIIWSTTPEAKESSVPILREIAAGIRAGDPLRRPITLKPDPVPPYSSGFLHGEDWLDFHSIQTWNAVAKIYPLVSEDYARKPPKPVLMAEGAYEAGSEYGFEVTPLWVRRQAYYSYLAGGHHTYGHNDSWRILPTWKEALDAPGARQMGILRKAFEALPEWWLLIPDQSLLVSGGRTEGTILRLAARHRDARWALVYLAEEAEVSVDIGKLRGAEVEARWIDPRSGEALSAGRHEAKGAAPFASPKGWEDALLVLEATSIPK